MARVELSNVGVLVVGVTSLVLFESEDEISKLAPLERSPVPTTEPIEETDPVMLDVRLGMGDTVIVKPEFEGRTGVERYDEGRPVPTKVVCGVGAAAVWDVRDKLELATLETGSIGNVISRDVRTDLTGRPVGINVIFLGVLNSVATPAVTVINSVVCR